MSLKEIASVSGKGGLYKVLAPAKSGMILESLDEARSRLIVTGQHKVSLLDEISIYTTTKEGNTPLGNILKQIHKDFKNDLGVDGNSDPNELRAFIKSVLPEYDESRVYISDIKKLVKWYEVIFKYSPEILRESDSKVEDGKKGEIPETQ